MRCAQDGVRFIPSSILVARMDAPCDAQLDKACLPFSSKTSGMATHILALCCLRSRCARRDEPLIMITNESRTNVFYSVARKLFCSLATTDMPEKAAAQRKEPFSRTVVAAQPSSLCFAQTMWHIVHSNLKLRPINLKHRGLVILLGDKCW